MTRMYFEQWEVIKQLTRERVVHDLGAGRCDMAVALWEAGADKVIAVDEHDYTPERHSAPGVEFIDETFEDFVKRDPEIDVALISWPSNRSIPALCRLAHRARLIIYLGSNVECSATGHADLFDVFLYRELLHYKPTRNQTLIVLGETRPYQRPPTGEEWAGLSQWYGHDWYTLAAAEENAARGRPYGPRFHPSRY